MKTKNKNIWMFHHYATPPSVNGMNRPYDFGVNLKEDYNITIFSASYLHYAGRNIINNNELYKMDETHGIPFVYIKTRGYEGNKLGRVFNMIDYYLNIFKVAEEFVKNDNQPDIIIASSPHPLVMVAGIKIAKKLGVPCICEIRDFWPEVIFLSGMITEKHPLGRALLKLEHWVYKNADSLIFLKEGDHTYISDKGWDNTQGGDVDLEKCYYINNGVNIDEFNKQILENHFEDTDLNNDKFNVIYAGSIRPVNNIDRLLDAAKLLQDYEDIQFLVYGEGMLVEELNARIFEENISNVKLKGYVSKKNIPYVLSKASANILNYSQSKYNWSRGNSSNKLFEYMASGKPVVSTVKMGYSIIEKYDCGVEVSGDTPQDIADAVLYLYNVPQKKYEDYSNNAKKGALDFDFNILSKKLGKVIEETTEKYLLSVNNRRTKK